jgi:hypothetical protein
MPGYPFYLLMISNEFMLAGLCACGLVGAAGLAGRRRTSRPPVDFAQKRQKLKGKTGRRRGLDI